MATFNNGESAASVRTKINAAIEKVDGTASSWEITADSLDLRAIAETKADTAVDVFVYDTSKDSDGGAWRKRTQHTSWYNETLNTATRGSRREFPAVAVIVAKAFKLTIYDGDDPSLPMWMVFENDGSLSWASGSSVAYTSVSAANGLVVPAGATGAILYNFVSDDTRLANVSAYELTSNKALVGRNGATSFVAGGNGFAIVNSTVNDCAMTVLPDAPIDPATGLPVPTIAVATDGGVSVIKDDGTVVDLTYSISSNEAGKVWFPSDGGIAWTSRIELGGYVYVYRENEIPSVDKSTAPNARYGNFTYVPNIPDLTFVGDTSFDALDVAIASNGGLTVLDEDRATPTEGMVAYTTSTYNTGWMPGDIKGAFLSDTDDTDLVGSGELVTNGTFDTDISGWTDPTDGRSTASFASGKMRITNDTNGYGYAYQILSLTVGKTYTVSWDVSVVGTLRSTRVFWGNAEGTTSGGGASPAAAVTGTQSITFVAQAATTYFSVQLFTSSVGPTVQMDFDNISVKLADEDRSVNNNGLIVNGTVSRDPVATGADLVAYSGFSASNYLEQPYNSDLDFGTGDFCVMGWIYTAASASQRIFDREGGTNDNYIIIYTSAGALGASVKDTTVLNLTAPTAINNSWVHFAAVRESGTFYLYVNGAVADSGASTQNVTNTVAPVIIGNRFNLSSPLTLGSLALLRISATAPTADQIAKIYEDEKVLFQENAQATLYGTSDAVTALAHDPVTDLLHVGTSDGRSVFQGLRRVENTTDAVTTAISANNGLVIEQ